MEIPVTFINEPTKQFYNCSARNICLCGGYGSGKTYIACLKALTLLLSFNKYRFVFAREVYKDLKQTTLKTFQKICPQKLIDRWDTQDGYMRLKNGSEVLWMHLDELNEQSMRGLEINSAYIDQPEEVQEAAYNLLDVRIGRWDKAVPSKKLLDEHNGQWPKDPLGNYVIPAYMMLTPNPDAETHWIYRFFHPESPLRRPNHEYFEVSSIDNPYLNKETLNMMLSRDPEWVKRFVFGQWGISEASIHQVLPPSILDVDSLWISNLLQKSNLYRALDHGDSSPTCCLFIAVNKNQYFFYNEYYQGSLPVSEHRANIASKSGREHYTTTYADPQIFKKTNQKQGNFYSIADEYRDNYIDAPPVHMLPGDNNELLTRNRINEFLRLQYGYKHPITSEEPAPRVYFVKKSDKHNYGIENLLVELRSQRRLKLGEVNGKPIFSDERDDNIPDHAYDACRYFFGTHARSPVEPKKKPSENSFLGARNRFKAVNQYYNQYGDLRPSA